MAINTKTTWYLLAGIFMIPALFHLFVSFQDINTIKMPYIPNFSIMTFKSSTGEEFDITKSYENAVNEINKQIKTQNSQNAIINRITFWGYLLTAFSCLLSGYAIERKNRKQQTSPKPKKKVEN